LIWKQRTLSFKYGILTLTNSTFLTADMILLCTKTLYPIHGSHSPFQTKRVFPCWYGATALPPNLTNIWILPSTVIRGPGLCTLSTLKVLGLWTKVLKYIHYIFWRSISM
jgi:hypothetical protein